MYSGVSGLQAEGESLGVVGDNIANSGTVGFKTQRTVFQDVLGRAAGSAAALPGAGVRLGDVQQVFTQGSLSNTGVATDLALSGEGFFVMQGTLGGVTGNFYTRDGRLNIDKDGFLGNSMGLKAQGYLARPDGTFDAAVSSLRVPTGDLPPHATTRLAVTANLDANATIPGAPWNAQTPSQSSNFSTTLSVFDSLGNAHDLDVYFRKSIGGAWDWHAVAKSSEVNGGVGTYTEVGSGSFGFNTSGVLTSSTTTSPITIDFIGAAAGQIITPDFGSATGAAGATTGMTQFAAPSNVSAQTQDGYSSGTLTGIGVDNSGVMRGSYSNGQQLAIGALTIAKFQANEQLGRAGAGTWVETLASGNPAYGTAGSGGRGAVSSGALELSNVDLAAQFVDLIAHQRSFEANSKTIATADEMLQSLQQLKR
ncbi:MAG: flagellar hook protein FlgE [Polyangiaceae bacterium]